MRYHPLWLIDAGVLYLSTMLIVIVGVVVGTEVLEPIGRQTKSAGAIERCCAADGRFYREILVEGYSYDADRPSTVAFFPAYPFLASLSHHWVGFAPESALLISANACLFAAFCLLSKYALLHIEGTNRSTSTRLFESRTYVSYVLLAFGLLPAGFFFRMAYSESLFLLIGICIMLGIRCQWSVLVVALLVGLISATRPTGVVFCLPLLCYIWRESPNWRQRLCRLAWSAPLSIWGLLAYAVFLFLTFDEPLAFALTQKNYCLRPPVGLVERSLSLASLEPITSVYLSGSASHWARSSHLPPLLNLQFANPIYFVGFVSLLGCGYCKRWINHDEAIVAGGVLAVSYVTRAYEMCFNSQARFAAAAFPVYLVFGHLLVRLPMPWSIALLTIGGLFLAINSALFVAGHPLY